uniref:Secreted protein n=1 Tax=Cyanoderma ruficeps TaxID=181631 RepID=A0A8C3NWS9_9PASS
IPIWSVMCFLMLMIRSAMPFTSISSYHSFRRSGVFRIIEAMRAPFTGGLEYMGRMRIFSCDSTLLASSASLQITVKAPSPMFLAKDCERTMLMPCSMKCRTAQASRLMSPLAKPW